MACTALAQINCAGMDDGSYGYGCRSFTKCEGGVGTVVNCDTGYAFDYRTGDCEPWSTVPGQCGAIDNDCSDHADGLYASQISNCTYFYTCLGGAFLGSNPCNNPPDSGNLVFDEILQVCNFYWDVIPPCGTLIIEVTTVEQEVNLEVSTEAEPCGPNDECAPL